MANPYQNSVPFQYETGKHGAHNGVKSSIEAASRAVAEG